MTRRQIWISTLLCTTLLTTQTLIQPALLSAATTSTFQTLSVTYQNPTYEEINQKLEAIAKEKNIPSILLKVIAFKESTWRQFDKLGNPVLGSNPTHPAIGIMQVATYSDSDTATIQKLKTDIDFNIRMGADLLNEKWNFTPRIGDGDRNKLENWYFALWAYNIWSERNNPNVLAAQSAQTGQVLLTYQEKIYNLCANPEGFLAQYITPVQITKIPNSSLPQVGVPAKTVQWTTPEPIHYGDLITEQPQQPQEPQPEQPQPEQPQVPKVLDFVRLAGNDRIDTAIQQAIKGWPSGAPAVVLARADDFPDALAGVPLAAKLGAPVLLTSSQSLDSRVEKALNTLKPEKIVLLGGEGALGNSISERLQDLGWGMEKQVRLSGVDRYSTAASIALETLKTGLHTASTETQTSVEAVALATGENFPDALSIASIAGAKQMPILLTEAKELPQETLKALQQLNPQKVYIIGGEGVIQSSVQTNLQSQLNLSASQVIRLAGVSRYDTMAEVAKAFAGENQGLSFATGEDFPDALAGAAMAARVNSTVILLPKSTLEDYPNLKTAINQYPWNLELQPYIFGGAGAISGEREQELKDLLSKS